MKKRLLLLSNSTNYGENYLEWPRPYIKEYLEKTGIKRVLFVPYAGVAQSENSLEDSFDAYEERVNSVFNEFGCEVYSIHRENDPAQSVRDSLAILVGGGNTFHLVYMLHELKLMKVIKEAVENGVVFIGWSAGANIACPTMRTTNDMPIIEPESLNCLGLVPFQINPHFVEGSIEGHNGEPVEQRIEEFLVINNNVYVVGLREGTILSIENTNIELKGAKPMRVFRHGQNPKEFDPGTEISFLM